ncbi:hypothetical protein ACHAXS_007539, partial [Conticribra weissflogii]
MNEIIAGILHEVIDVFFSFIDFHFLYSRYERGVNLAFYLLICSQFVFVDVRHGSSETFAEWIFYSG